jgi:DNA-binding NarL/FixJ family response regulator
MKIYVIDNTGQIQTDLLISQPNTRFFSDEIQAVNAVDEQSPDLILLHYHVRNKETARYIDLLLTISPTSDIILLGDHLTEDQIVHCLLQGAKGYQNITDLATYIDKIIKVISEGEAWISRRLTSCMMTAIRKQNSLDNSDSYYFSGQYTFSATHQKN